MDGLKNCTGGKYHRQYSDSPGHQFHGIPDIDNVQKMPDVGNDIIKVLRKHIDVILDVYPVPFTSKEKEGGSEE